eukprot:12217644-Ditylum_brightwellii.AAC.1
MDLHHHNEKRKHQLLMEPVESSILTQYHVSKGLKVFGKEGTGAVMSELKQLHERMVMDPKRPESMTREEKKESLQYLMFLTKNRCG